MKKTIEKLITKYESMLVKKEHNKPYNKNDTIHNSVVMEILKDLKKL